MGGVKISQQCEAFMKIRYGVLAVAMGLTALSAQAKADYLTYSAPFVEPTVVLNKCFVGARIRVNTQASLARGSRTVVSDGATTYSSTRLAPVYFSTQRVVKPQYVYLTPGACY